MSRAPVGLALTIGLNHVDPRFYAGAPDLAGCLRDVSDMADIFRSQGFTVAPSLLNDRATTAALDDALDAASACLEPGDCFLIHYSGHGMDNETVDTFADGTRWDRNTSWCLYDGPYPDDRLFDAWFQFRPGVRIVVLSDSCHSGTATRAVHLAQGLLNVQLPTPRAPSPSSQAETLARNVDYFRDMAAQSRARQRKNKGQVPPTPVLLLAACRDDETAGDLPKNGLFTGSVKEVWDGGRYKGDYADFLARVALEVGKVSPWQRPQIFPLGDPGPAGDLYASPPFRI